MKLSIDVSTYGERDALKRTLDDPVLRAAMIVAGTLLDLKTREERARVIDFARLTCGSPESGDELRLHDGATKGNGREAADTGE
jgi:hypothetical protein